MNHCNELHDNAHVLKPIALMNKIRMDNKWRSKKTELYSSLWASFDDLRGGMGMRRNIE